MSIESAGTEVLLVDVSLESPSVADLEVVLHQTSNQYLMACNQFAEHPNQTNHAVVLAACQEHTETFDQLAVAFREGRSLSEYGHALLSTLTHYQSAHAAGLNSTLREKIIPMPKVTFKEPPGRLTPAAELKFKRQLGRMMSAEYAADAVLSTNLFTERVGELKPSLARQFNQRTLAAHALDVGKIVMGTAIGAALGAKLFSRKLR